MTDCTAEFKKIHKKLAENRKDAITEFGKVYKRLKALESAR